MIIGSSYHRKINVYAYFGPGMVRSLNGYPLPDASRLGFDALYVMVVMCNTKSASDSPVD
jgi:hypothetical protein